MYMYKTIVHVTFRKFIQNLRYKYSSIIHVFCVSAFVQWYHSGLLPWSRKVCTIDAGIADVYYAIISALSLSSLQLMPSSHVALVADIFRNCL